MTAVGQPSIPEIRLTGGDDGQSLAEARLANVVLREYSLTLGVVRTANTAHYRHTGRPIQSATHATMSAITAFSHDLTAAIYRPEGGSIGTGPSADAARAVDAVIERHDAHVRVSREQVRDVVESALDETRELFSTSRIVMEPPKLKALSDAARLAVGLSVPCCCSRSKQRCAVARLIA